MIDEDDGGDETFDAYIQGRFAARSTPEGPVTNPYPADSPQYNAFEAGVAAEREPDAAQ